MRTVGLCALTFVALLVLGRIAGRDALLWISVACNLILIGMRVHHFFIIRERRNRS